MRFGKSTRQGQEQGIWDQVLAGDVAAFEVVVQTHQSSVSAVAYAILGDFAISQDIAQETFWTAWNSRSKLRDPKKLASWLCGIARNLAKQWRRKNRRSDVVELKPSMDPVSVMEDPLTGSISAEELAIVWSSLQEIPENYREVLVLYYRQGQSISEVAAALEISEDAARQRLSRGRNALRGRVWHLVEGVLDSTRPGRSFTSKVLAGITGASVAQAAATATAATTATKAVGGSVLGAAAKGVGAGAAAGTVGGGLGLFGGLLGGWLGNWLPAQMAPTEAERQLLTERGRQVMKLAVAFALTILGLTLIQVTLRPHWLFLLIGLLISQLAFMIPLFIHSRRTMKMVRQLRRELSAEDDPNLSPIGQKLNARQGLLSKVEGRRYRSRLKLLGWPLIDIQVSNPSHENISLKDGSVARGWIAIGDIAYGLLFAFGLRIGVGLISFGPLAVGGVAFGGLAVGLLAAVGGGAVGYQAFGGGAIGWDACGGGAVGIHSAAGGGAIAYHAAVGGAAVAKNYAVGGGAFAAEANTPRAEQVIEQESWKPALDWTTQYPTWFGILIAVVCLVPSVCCTLCYRKRQTTSQA